MTNLTTSAIMLRRINYGDDDLVITFFSREKGKIAVFAKSAKKSIKRFAGTLELFSVLQIVFSNGKGSKPSYLYEAIIKRPFANIRADIKKMAYASYWAELTDRWMKVNVKEEQLYQLLYFALHELNDGCISPDALSILFQMKFSALVGFRPNLAYCADCRIQLEEMGQTNIQFDLAKGGVICPKCAGGHINRLSLSMGTIRQLQWIENGDLKRAKRIRFSPQPLREGLALLEAFLPFHLENTPRSLKFLHQIR
jgi:DNA repair protein RecO (recombination protein O)